jgi:hypothetical protein
MMILITPCKVWKKNKRSKSDILPLCFWLHWMAPLCEPYFFPILVLAYLSNQPWSAWPHLSFLPHKKAFNQQIGCLPKPALISHMQSLSSQQFFLFCLSWHGFHNHFIWRIDVLISSLPPSLPPSLETNHNPTWLGAYPTWLVQRY